MQRHILLLLFSLLGIAPTYGQDQDNVPIIKATSSSVDISVGDDFFLKGGWHLEPNKNPDVFSIGSKWPYQHKKVSFITNIDSISFDVQPGNTYNFIILLNDSTPCYTQIVTSPDPVFMNSTILLAMGIGFIIIVMLFYLKRDQVNVIYLLRLGYVVTLLFWVMVLISGEIHGDYNHLKNVISELGAIGTGSEVLTSTSLILLSVLCMLFSIGFYKASLKLGLSRIPAILSFSKPVSLVWAAIFPMGNEFHSATGPLPLLIILTSLLSFLLWKKEKIFFRLRIISLFSCFIMLLILLRFVEPFAINYAGLIQRFFYLGWTVWTVAVSYYLIRILNIEKRMVGQTISR